MCAYCGFCISASYRLRLLRRVLIVQMIIESLLRNDRRKLSRFPVPGQSSCLCRASGGPRHRLPERADKPTIYPHHQIDVAPLNVACAVVIPVRDPVRRGGERFFRGCKKLIIRCSLPVRSPVKPVHLNVRDSQRLRDSPAKRAFPTSAGAYDIDFHRSACTC